MQQENNTENILTVNLSRQSSSELLRSTQVRTFTQAKRYVAYVLRFIFALIRRVNTKGNIKISPSIIKDEWSKQESSSMTGPEIR